MRVGRSLQVRPQDRSTPVRRAIAELAPWFQNVHLPDGSETAPEHPLGDFPAFKWRAVAEHLPADLSGWTALDVGCNAAFYSVELARRGARVTALDPEEHYLAQARFVVAQCGLGERIEVRRGSVYELARSGGRWDLVCFLGVLYHLRHPLLALDALAERTGRLLWLQTLTLPDAAAAGARAPLARDWDFEQRERLARPDWPRAAFVEHCFAGDPTNWWIPDAAAVEAMLRSSGFRITARPERECWLAVPAPDAPGAQERRRELRDAAGGEGAR